MLLRLGQDLLTLPFYYRRLVREDLGDHKLRHRLYRQGNGRALRRSGRCLVIWEDGLVDEGLLGDDCLRPNRCVPGFVVAETSRRPHRRGIKQHTARCRYECGREGAKRGVGNQQQNAKGSLPEKRAFVFQNVMPAVTMFLTASSSGRTCRSYCPARAVRSACRHPTRHGGLRRRTAVPTGYGRDSPFPSIRPKG